MRVTEVVCMKQMKSNIRLRLLVQNFQEQCFTMCAISFLQACVQAIVVL